MGRRVLFLASGVYPHYVGGVSTWADLLLTGLSEYEFDVVSVVSNPHVTLRYSFPPNVRSLTTVPMWGTELPEEYLPASLAGYLTNVARTTDAAVEQHFIPAFQAFLEQIRLRGRDPETFGQALKALSDYFEHFDFTRSTKAQPTWEAFQQFLLRDEVLRTLTVAEAIDNLRLLCRYLRVLLVRPQRVDIAHSAIASVAGLIGVVAKLRHRSAYVLTEHGIYIRERLLDLVNQDLSQSARLLAHNFHTAVARLNYHYADVVSPVCDYNSTWEGHYGVGPAKIRTIYNGVDVDRFAPIATRPRLQPRWPFPAIDQASQSVPTVVAVIRLDRLKDPMNLVRAMRLVRDRFATVRCRIYGPAPDLSYARSCEALRAELHLEDCVTFEGFVRRPEDAYGQADVVVMSSLSEGFPFAVVEAMATGKPIVATDVGGVREALGDAGLLVPPRQPRELAEAINRLLSDRPFAAQLGQRARERVLSHYQVGGLLQGYRNLYAALGA